MSFVRVALIFSFLVVSLALPPVAEIALNKVQGFLRKHIHVPLLSPPPPPPQNPQLPSMAYLSKLFQNHVVVSLKALLTTIIFGVINNSYVY
jgi:hypothetical protein